MDSYLYIGPSGFNPEYGMLHENETLLILTEEQAAKFGPRLVPYDATDDDGPATIEEEDET